jgi:hypothetical protein
MVVAACVEAEDMANEGDWCAALKSAPVIVDDADARWLQRLKLTAILQHQSAHVDGVDRNGRDFHNTASELRRFWIGADAKFFDVLGLNVLDQMSNDRSNYPGGELELGHETFQSAHATLDLKRLADLEALDLLELGYGRRIVRMAHEFQTSCYLIDTLERSSFATKFWPCDEEGGGALGAWVKTGIGDSTLDVALLSGTYDDYIGGWSGDSKVLYAAWQTTLAGEAGFDVIQWWLSGFHQWDSEPGKDSLGFGAEWAGLASTMLVRGPWEVRGSVGVGGNGEQGNPEREGYFAGLVFQPMVWLIEDRLKLVFRYQLLASGAAEGIRLNSRYLRVAEADAGGLIDLNNGYGDRNHNAYLGLVIPLCDDKLKVLFGTEYDDLSSNGETMTRGWTTSASLRVWF